MLEVRILTGIYYILMEDCAEGFRENGCDVLYPGVRKSPSDPQIFYSEDDFRSAVEKDPFDIFFSINGDALDDNGEILRKLMDRQKTIVIWYVDDPLNPFAPWNIDQRVPRYAADYDRLHFFAIDKTFVDKIKSRGHRKAFFLPHAASLAWAAGAHALARPPASLVTFVGNLDLDNLEKFQDIVSRIGGSHPKKISDFVEARMNSLTLSWDEFLASSRSADIDPAETEKLAHLANRIATIRCKIHVIQTIEGLGVDVYGFEDWRKVLKFPRSYKGHVSYYHGLSTVYRTSFVTLNLTHAQLAHGCNQRVLDVWAAGGFLLTDAGEILKDLFPEVKMPTFATLHDLVRQLTEIVKQPEKRFEQHSKILEEIRARHTYKERMKTVLETVQHG